MDKIWIYVWKQRKLGDVAEIIGGGTPKTSINDYWDGEINWYAPAEIGNLIYVSSSQRKITKLGLNKSSAKILPVGTVLFTSRAGIGKTAILACEGCTNQGFQSIVPRKGMLDSYFIFVRTEELKRYAETVGAGSTFVEVSGKQMMDMELMLPITIEEQQKIGNYFAEIDSLITFHHRKLNILNKICRYAWEQRKLGEIAAETYGGGTPKTSNEGFWKGNIPWIQSSDLIDECLFDVKPRKCISQEAVSKSATKLVPQNSIAIVTRVGVGKLAFMPFSYATSQDFLSLSGLKTNPEFTVYALYKMMQLVSNEVQGTSIKGVTKDELLAKKIMIPCCNEQKKIGVYLHNLDHLITLHQRKYDETKKLKKCMLQKMFPKEGEKVPEIRFSGFTGDWKQRKFGDMVIIERGGSPRPIDKFITEDENGLSWVKIGDAPEQGNYITRTKEKIKTEGLSKTREVHPGDLILSNSMSFGRPYIMAIDGCIHDGWLLIRDHEKKFDLKYLCCMLGTDMMLFQYKQMAAGSTVNNLNKELVGNTVVKYPSPAEQSKIGVYFSTLDGIITLHKKKCDELRNIKKFMLQNMFI